MQQPASTALEPQLFTPGIANEPEPQATTPQGHRRAPTQFAPTTGASAAPYGAAPAAPQRAMSMQHASSMSIAGDQGLAKQMGGMTIGGGNALYGTDGNVLQTVNVASGAPPVDQVEFPPPDLRLPPGATSAPHGKFVQPDPSYHRCTLNAIPATASLLSKSKLPLAVVLSPYRSQANDEPVPVSSDHVISRCRRCKGYINPFVTFVENGRRWKCPMCNLTNEVPIRFDWDDDKNRAKDRWERPELTHAVVDFIAPRSYTVRPPPPLYYIFCIDVGGNAVRNGSVATAAKAIRESLDKLPDADGRTCISIIAVDQALGFFHIPEGATEFEMLVVADVQDPFLPKSSGLIWNLAKCRPAIESLLDNFGSMFEPNALWSHGSAMGAALQIAYKMIMTRGGKIACFASQLPSLGPGALTDREDLKALGTGKESSFLGAATSWYKSFPVDCSRAQISVDMWLFSSSYQDVASLSCLPHYTGGQTFFYPSFDATKDEDRIKFSTELKRILAEPLALEAVLRLRASNGIRPARFHGNFFVRSTDLLALPTVSLDQNYVIECEIDEPLVSKFVVFQSVVLMSTPQGERRIRVTNMAVPTSASLSEVYASADQVALAVVLANKAVEKSIHGKLEDARDLVFNRLVELLTSFKQSMTTAGSGAITHLQVAQNLQLLPLLCLGLLKNVGLKQSSQIDTDVRAYAHTLLSTMPAQTLIPFLLPNLYPLHDMPAEAGTWVDLEPEGSSSGLEALPEEEEEQEGVGATAADANGEGVDDQVGDEDTNGVKPYKKPTKKFIMPPRLNPSQENMHAFGLYLIENGQTIYVWLGRTAVPQLLVDVWGVATMDEVPSGPGELPNIPESSMNQRVRAVIDQIRDRYRSAHLPALVIVKEAESGDPFSPGVLINPYTQRYPPGAPQATSNGTAGAGLRKAVAPAAPSPAMYKARAKQLLIEDREPLNCPGILEGGMSYAQFLNKVRSRVNGRS